MSRGDLSIWELIDAAYLGVNRYLIDRLHQAGFTELRVAHAKVFEQLVAGAVTVSQIAERTQTTKQSMRELVEYLESAGYLTRTPDSTDRRAKRVILTERGKAAVDEAWAGLELMTRSLEARLGGRRVAETRETLIEILEMTQPASGYR